MAEKTVETILRDTIVAASEEDGISGPLQLQLVEALRTIYNSGFAKQVSTQALESAHPKIRGRLASFVIEATELLKKGG